MIATFNQILERTLERLAAIATTYVPPLLAGLVILAVAFGVAVLVRWLLLRVARAAGFERFLAQSGLSSMLAGSGRIRAGILISRTAYLLILLAGLLTALSAFDTTLTSRMIEAVVLLLPKLVTAAAILVAGAWLAQYFSRSMLVWACNEGLPWPRRFAAAVRVLVVFIAVVAAADHLDFARSVFLAGFVIVVGGAVLTAAIAAGIGLHHGFRRHIEQQESEAEPVEKSLWNHL